MIEIERCEKRPGVFVGARVYKLLLTNDGLYAFELGKGMGARNKSTELSDYILDRMAEKRGAGHAEKSAEINAANLTEIVDNKKNFLVTKENVKEVKASRLDRAPQISIKSSVLNITLHCGQNESDKLRQIESFFQG